MMGFSLVKLLAGTAKSFLLDQAFMHLTMIVWTYESVELYHPRHSNGFSKLSHV